MCLKLRIPFAAANLSTALSAVQSNMGLTFVALIMLVLALVWSLLWFVGLGGAVSSSNGGIVFLLLVSYYWVHQVLTNIVHVTSAGTVATWWYAPLEAMSWWSRAIQDSYFRATTYSFGSICFGSLLVAVVQALRTMAHMARQNDDMQILSCILECILAMIQDIIEYLNKWAYVYVGIYGFPYLESGRNVIQLLESKGWTVIITDDLCDRALFLVSLGVGLLTGVVGWLVAAANNNLLAALSMDDGVGMGGFV
jgi:Plasma-membrane choline transporter